MILKKKTQAKRRYVNSGFEYYNFQNDKNNKNGTLNVTNDYKKSRNHVYVEILIFHNLF